jgi:arginyl-tRNA synthetase
MIKDILEEITDKITLWLTNRGIENPMVHLERSAVPEFGDYFSNVAMCYAKELKENPLKLASELADFLQKSEIEAIEKTDAVKPGFVNMSLTTTAKVKHVNSILIAGEGYGRNKTHQSEKWVIEHTSPNPNKAMHLGHLRNNLVGMGIVRLLMRSGAEVVSDAVYNNRGIAIAKVMYGYLVHMKQKANIPTDINYWAEHQEEWFTPEERNQKPDIFVTECYVLGERDFTKSSEVEEVVRQMVVDWEAGGEAVWALWDYVLQIAYSGIDRTLTRLGNHWDKVWFEHEHYQRGKEYVEKGIEKGIFQTLPDGAVLTKFEPTYSLPETILLKNDGTALYITQDIALTDLKKKTYKADKLVWVIGPDQSLAMKQLFAVCEQLGIGNKEDFTHVSYGYVGLKDQTGIFQKMSSRAGTVVLIDDVIDGVKNVIKTRFKEENKYSETVQNELSEKLALAAVKFSFLKSDKNQGISFDITESVDVQGDSGMYVMYTYVRTQSILRKVGAEGTDQTTLSAMFKEEASLVRSLLYFDEIIMKATADLSVHHVAQYLLEVSSEFNRWYAKEIILDGTDRESYKLNIVKAVAITLQNGLDILGIETINEM